MARFVQILLVVSLGISLCVAEIPRARLISRFQVERTRLLARQEAENYPAVVTPYPSADELKPEVPFDEPATAAAAEEQIPNQPDEVYGPPEQEDAVETNDIVPIDEEEPTEEEEEADLVGEEDAISEEEAAIAAEEAAIIASSRLTARRDGFRRVLARPAKLRKVTVSRLQLQPQIVPQPVFYYVAQ